MACNGLQVDMESENHSLANWRIYIYIYYADRFNSRTGGNKETLIIDFHSYSQCICGSFLIFSHPLPWSIHQVIDTNSDDLKWLKSIWSFWGRQTAGRNALWWWLCQARGGTAWRLWELMSSDEVCLRDTDGWSSLILISNVEWYDNDIVIDASDFYDLNLQNCRIEVAEWLIFVL